MTTIFSLFLFSFFVTKMLLSHEGKMNAVSWFGNEDGFFVEAVEQLELNRERASPLFARCTLATMKA